MDYYLPSGMQPFGKRLKNIITQDSFKKALHKLYSDRIINLEYDQQILVFFKVKAKDGPYRNISTLQKVNKLEFFNLIEIFIEI